MKTISENMTAPHIEEAEIERQRLLCETIEKELFSRGFDKERRPGYYIQTFGCQQNEADSERMAGIAWMMGYRPVSDPAAAELILVNTCAIREHAEKKALSIIGTYKHVKDKNPGVIIGVGGCMVAQNHRADQLKNSYPYVNFSFDPGALHLLPELIYHALTGGKRRFVSSDTYAVAEGLPAHQKQSFKAWLSIMYGCNNFCSYCIVPYVRGRERSRTPEAILEEARRLINGGARDITLLGQNVNSYGKDIGSVDIASLMRQICALPGDFRLRFMTSHPKDASDALIAAMAEEEKIVPHFHLPVQSGSDTILRRMNRKYTAQEYLRIIDKLKNSVPDVSLTSDIIVGFPGETDADFQDTLDMLASVEYDAIFSFIYSPRKGTPAATMEGQIPREVSSRRFEQLLTLQHDISRARNQRFVGRTVRALCEEVSKTDPDKMTARGDSPRPIHFENNSGVSVGEYCNLEIVSADTFSLYGNLK